MRLRPLLIVAMMVGCGGAQVATPYQRSFSEAERAETAGRFGDAATRYDEAARVAPSPRERSHASYLAAKMLAESGNLADAAKRLAAIAAERPATEHTARAAYDLADMHVDHGDADGWAEMDAMMRTFPSHGLARRALERLVVHHEEESKEKALAWLTELAPKMQETELGESVAYQRANLLHTLGRNDEAHDAYLAIVARWKYPFGATFDDSLYHAAEIDEGRGRPQEAIDHLEAMLAERETSSLMGSYQRPRYTPALEYVARLQEEKLHDHAAARATWHRLYADFTTSVRRDDALWNEAELWRADGDGDTACSRLKTLVKEFPDSRYVPCAEERCKGLERASKSAAPKTCRRYIEERSKK